MDHKLRAGRFTSSQIYRLLGTPAVQKTYIDEVKIERRLGKTLGTDFFSKAASWGYLMELLAFNDLGLEYQTTTKDTQTHGKYGAFWSGTPDLLTAVKVGEIKGYEYKKWCKLTDTILEKDVEKLQKDHKKEFWQIVSNCVVTNRVKGEIITYMPYEAEFETIKQFIEGIEPTQSPEIAELYEQIKWVQWADKSKVCLLPDNGFYNKMNRFEFDITPDMVTEITNAVIKGIELIK